MNILPIGIGGAGHRVVEHFISRTENNDYEIPDGVAIDAVESEFYFLDKIPEENCVLLDTGDVEFSTVIYRPILTIRGNDKRLQNTIDEAISEKADCFLVIGGLGGQMGSHAGVVADWLQEQYDRPVYGLGILPAEKEGNLAAAYAISGLTSLQESSDGVILFDNEEWLSETELELNKINNEIVNRLGLIFWAAASDKRTSGPPLTKEKLKETLSTGDYTTCGFASKELNKPRSHGFRLAASKEERRKKRKKRLKQWANKDRRKVFSLLSEKSIFNVTFPFESSDVDGCENALILTISMDDILLESNLNAAQVGVQEAISASLGDTPIGNIDTVCFGLDKSQIAIITLFCCFNNRSTRIRKIKSMAQEVTRDIEQSRRSEDQDRQPQSSLIDRLNSMKDTAWKQDHLLSCSSEEFEQLIAELYQIVGDDSKLTQASRDGGVDIIVDQRGGKRLVVQVKQYSPENQVGKPTVQQTIGVREEHKGDVAVIITSSEFSQPARKLEKSSNGVRLVDGRDLVNSLNGSPLNAPYAYTDEL